MELLNLGGSDESAAPKRSLGRFKKMGLGLALVAVAATVSTTLAGAININGGSNGNGSVTFGQGVATTASCDDQINLSPASTYDSYENHFYLQTLTFSDIAIGCLGKRLTILAYNSDGNLVGDNYQGGYGPSPFVVDFVQTGDNQGEFRAPNAENNFYNIAWNNDVNTIVGNSYEGGANGAPNETSGQNSFALEYIYDEYANLRADQIARVTIESSEIPSNSTSYTGCNFWCWYAPQHGAPTQSKQAYSTLRNQKL